jgi:hypothetical protein
MQFNVRADKVKSEAQRLFSFWLSVETEDSQGEVLKIDGMWDDAQDWVHKYGGTLHLGHTNRVVGQALEIKRMAYDGPRAELHGLDAIKVTKAKIYKSDIAGKGKLWDETWKAIKNGELSMTSLGGEGDNEYELCDENGCRTIVESTNALYEAAIVPAGANPGADIDGFNALAKAVPDLDNMVNLIMGCPDCDKALTNMVREGRTVSQSIIKFISSTEGNSMETMDKKKETGSEGAPAPTGIEKVLAEMAKTLTALALRMDQLEKQEEPPTDDEEDKKADPEDDKKPEECPKSKSLSMEDVNKAIAKHELAKAEKAKAAEKADGELKKQLEAAKTEGAEAYRKSLIEKGVLKETDTPPAGQDQTAPPTKRKDEVKKENEKTASDKFKAGDVDGLVADIMLGGNDE